jgi:hypothetical protein
MRMPATSTTPFSFAVSLLMNASTLTAGSGIAVYTSGTGPSADAQVVCKLPFIAFDP